MDLDFIEFIERKSRFKNNMRYMMTSRQIEYVPGKEGVGWEEGEIDDIWSGPDKDYIGRNFSPFKHNYAYGISKKDSMVSAYRALNEDQASKDLAASILKDIEKTVGKHDETEDFVEYVIEHKGPPLALIIQAFRNQEVHEHMRVYCMWFFFKIEAARFKRYNDATMIVLPVYLLSQLYTVGWKRTLLLWSIGILASEGVSYQVPYPFTGWSIITYMIHGQMWNETFSDRKLRTVAGGITNLRGLLINGVGGYGAYLTGEALWNDPAPFLQKSQKTGVHHGMHHMGALLGFLLNRWTR